MKARRQEGHVLYILARLHSPSALIKGNEGWKVLKSTNHRIYLAGVTFAFAPTTLLSYFI